MTPVDYFRSLHHRSFPILIGNVWNVASAQAFKRLKFEAIATSSAAVAESMGYHDGEEMPFDEYLHIVKRIRQCVDLPLSVDMETGFGRTVEDVVENLVKLSSLGVVGVNLEESRLVEGKRQLTEPHGFAERMSTIVTMLKERKADLFVNLRCDPFILRMEGARAETLKRLAIYDALPIDGIFTPCAVDIEDIRAITSATRHPVNILCMPGLPHFLDLQNAGVRRLSMGDFAYEYLYRHLESATHEVIHEGSFRRFFS